MKPMHASYSRSDALHLWQAVTMAMVRSDGPDFSARQMAILTAVYLDETPHTVRSLAESLCVTKAVITRALDTLGRHRMIKRCADPRDKRSITVGRTALGSRYLAGFADNICSHIPEPKQNRNPRSPRVVVPLSLPK
jgi:DNA-binding MarR family transcriptional regulator